MFYLKNLSSVSVERGDPWEFTKIEDVPAECLGKTGKSARTDWMTAPLTDFHAYSLWEGVNSNLRIRGPSGSKDDEGNPPQYAHGHATDYDYALTEAEIEAAIARMDIKPNWRETTLSGNCRLIWLYAKPIPIPSYAFAVAWCLSLDQIIPFRQMAGIDEGALKAPERYYTNGCRWQKLNPLPVPHALLVGHLVRVSAKFDFRGPEFGVSIPLDVVAQQLRIKYPKFAEWPGDFTLDAQGPSFWVDASESPKSAIVRETGMQTFSGHAHKPFFNWAELIGGDFCARFKTEQLGSAVTGIFYDEKHYFSKNSQGIWCIDPKENIVGLLKQERGLSDIKRKGDTTTEIERGLVYIQRNQRIKTAAPFAFYPEGEITVLGEKVLNTHTRKALAPSPEPGDFPWIANFLHNLFLTEDQLVYFISWLSYFYRSCYLRAPRSGHCVFIAGGTSVGKTFLSRGIIGGLVGGFCEANQFLMGEDTFNSELFDCGLWCIDDASIASDFKAHKRFSEMIKRIVANPSIRCNGKFLKANTVAWQGRIIITLNTDAESVRMLPDLDISLREKIMIFRTVEVSKIAFMTQDKMEAMLARELPLFARYLLDYQIPVECQSADPRFGVRNYLEPSLVNTANQSSISGTFAEILEEFTRAHFTEREPHADKWEGTALQLHKSIMLDPTICEAMKPFNVQSVGRMMISLAAKKVFDISVSGGEGSRIFTIHRDETRFPRTKMLQTPKSTGPSGFQKS
jgi:hypothetical protein